MNEFFFQEFASDLIIKMPFWVKGQSSCLVQYASPVVQSSGRGQIVQYSRNLPTVVVVLEGLASAVP